MFRFCFACAKYKDTTEMEHGYSVYPSQVFYCSYICRHQWQKDWGHRGNKSEWTMEFTEEKRK